MKTHACVRCQEEAVTVSRWMTRTVITIDQDDPVSLAFHLLLVNDIRHLPVVSQGRPVGIITDRDLKEALIPSDPTQKSRRSYHRIKNVKAKKIMTPNPILVSPETPLEEAAQILLERKISCLPVRGPDGSLVGILTVTDILRAFIEFMRALGTSQRIDILMESDAYDPLCRLLRKQGARIVSVGIIPSDQGGRNVYSFRLQGADLSALAGYLRDQGFRVLSS
jgi:acetoin utilization protein AcuB